jgi:hypothetical protein
MAVKYLGDYGPDGVCMGRAAADKLGFYGTTPVVQGSVSTTAITTAAITTTTNNYGFANTTQLTDLCAIVAEMRTYLIAAGLMA